MDELNYIKQKIEVMDKKDQINILKLFKDENGKFDVSDSNTMINYLKTLNG